MATKAYPPSPGASPKGALPKSSVKRRKFLRESDDDSGVMLIEHYIYRRDRYRSSSTAFPFPLPLSTENLQPILQDQLTPSTSVLQAIVQVLQQHRIEPQSIQVLAQFKKGYPRGDEAVPVLHIAVSAGEQDQLEGWSAARRDITAILDDHDLSDLEVEIEDPERFYQPSLFPIHPKHPAIVIFKSARDEMFDQIVNTIGAKWQMLSLFEVGRTAQVKKPTVVFVVEPLSSWDWKILKASLEAILDRRRGNLPKISVEIVPGATGPVPPQSHSHEQEQDTSGISFMDDFRSHPRHGTSIGVQGEQGGGTLGGYFKMRSPEKMHTGFLTNSHVVAPPSSEPLPVIIEYDALGLSYHASQVRDRGTYIHYFALKDIRASIASGNNSIQSRRDSFRDYEDQERMRQERGQATPQTHANLQSNRHRLIKEIEAIEKNLKSAARMPRLYGRTILASGRALTNKMMTLDYAFVETSAVGGRGLPSTNDFLNAKARPGDLGLSESLSLPARSQEFSIIQPGRWYFKIGRTTGLTSGICNGVEAWVKPGHQHTLFDSKGAVKSVRRAGKVLEVDQQGRLIYDEHGKPKQKEGDERYYYSSEWVIVNGSVNPLSFNKQQEFCAPGDSGSLIVDSLGRVSGILWGNLRGFCGPMSIRRPYVDAGLVTSIEDVKEFMKMTLSWPSHANVDVLQFP